LARKPRGWTGARTPSALKRVRTAERRAEVNQPRRSAAKTLVSKAIKVATGGQSGDAVGALKDALSALDRAAKAGAIHANAAARRKSRLTRKVNAALGGARVQTAAKLTKTTGKSRQDAHRARQGGQGQGRPDGGRQGPGSAQQDGSSRGRRNRGRRRSEGRDEVNRQGRGQARRQVRRIRKAGAGRRRGEDLDDQGRSGQDDQGTGREGRGEAEGDRQAEGEDLDEVASAPRWRRHYRSIRRSTTGPVPPPVDRAAG
jgi:small subunit ribosomal protein S20